MLDPITALGVAGNVVQFVDFGVNLLTRGFEIRQTGSTRGNDKLEALTRDLINLSDNLKTVHLSDAGGSVNLNDDEQALDDIAKDCASAAQDLIDRLKTLKVNNKNGPWATVRQVHIAVKTIWGQQEMEEMADRLNTYRHELALRILILLNGNTEKHASDQKDSLCLLDKKGDDIIEAISISQKFTAHEAARNRFFRERTQRQLDRAVTAVLTHRNGRTTTISPHPHSAQTDTNSASIMRVRGSDEPNMTGPGPQVSIRDFGPVQHRVLESLSFRKIRDRVDEVALAHHATLEWIFQDPEPLQRPWANFMQWLETGNGCYWVNGKAGSGKSTLMKHVCNDKRTQQALSTWAKDRTLVVASFFFYNLGSTLQKSQIGLLRSLLHDILAQIPELVPSVLPSLCWAASKGEEDLEASFVELRKGFASLLQECSDSMPRKICLFIDGIDEFEGNHAEISNFFTSISSPNIKIVISSRPIPACIDIFADFPSLRLQDLTYDDIRSYTHEIIGARKRWCEMISEQGILATRLIDEIAEKSSGVFLWVILAVASLLDGLRNYDRVADLRRRLEELPGDLEDLYSHMLNKLQPLYQQQASQILQIVYQQVNAEEDQPLSALQLSFSDEEDLDYAIDYSLEPLSISQQISRGRATEARVRSRCCGLVEIWQDWRLSEKDRILQSRVMFLHRTVVEFLRDSTVWDGITNFTKTTTFDPNVALANCFLLDMKTTPHNIADDGSYNPVVQKMNRCLLFCRLAEGTTHRPQTRIVDELGRAAELHQDMIPALPGGSNRQTRRNFDPIKSYRLIKLHGRLLRGYEPDFLHFEPHILINAAIAGLALYIQEKCTNVWSITIFLPAQHAFAASIYCAYLALSISGEGILPIQIYSGVIRRLLDVGVDPNRRATDRGSSPWMVALHETQSLLDFQSKRWLRTTEDFLAWVGILEQLLLHGADPNAWTQPHKSDTPALFVISSLRRKCSSSAPELVAAIERLEMLLFKQGAKSLKPDEYDRSRNPASISLSPGPDEQNPSLARISRSSLSQRIRPFFKLRRWKGDHVK